MYVYSLFEVPDLLDQWSFPNKHSQNNLTLFSFSNPKRKQTPTTQFTTLSFSRPNTNKHQIKQLAFLLSKMFVENTQKPFEK